MSTRREWANLKGEDRLRAAEADFTPAAVVFQPLERLKQLNFQPRWAFDPAAGGGIFTRCIREVWPTCFTCALEPRPEEEPSLRDSCDVYNMRTFEEWLADLDSTPVRQEVTKFDLIATNPPFGLLAPKKGESWIPKLLDLLAPGGILALYALNDLGQRSEAGTKLFTTHPPDMQWRIPGTVGHRAGGKTDTRDYSWWLWCDDKRWCEPDHDITPHWTTRNLPRLEGKQRRLGNHYLDRLQTVV